MQPDQPNPADLDEDGGFLRAWMEQAVQATSVPMTRTSQTRLFADLRQLDEGALRLRLARAPDRELVTVVASVLWSPEGVWRQWSDDERTRLRAVAMIEAVRRATIPAVAMVPLSDGGDICVGAGTASCIVEGGYHAFGGKAVHVEYHPPGEERVGVSLTPDEARQLAASLVEAAGMVEGRS